MSDNNEELFLTYSVKLRIIDFIITKISHFGQKVTQQHISDLPSALSSVCVPDMVHGSGDVERL